MNLHDSTSLAPRLPGETLRCIFIHSLPQIDHLLPKSQSSPMLLTRICRRWKEVSEDMPSLWCRLLIKVDQTNLPQWSFCYDSWLKRTQRHPLFLEITCFTNDSTYLRPLLQPYVHQVYSLNVMFGNARAPENLLNDLSALQELRVDTSRDSPGSQVYHTLPSISPPISRLSILHTLKFEGGRSILNLDLLSRLNPVWAHLTNVAIEFIRGISDDEILLERESFTHTNIQSLSIAYRFSTYRCKRIYPRAYPLAPFLNALMLPNLRILNIGERSWTGEELNAVGSGTAGMSIRARLKLIIMSSTNEPEDFSLLWL